MDTLMLVLVTAALGASVLVRSRARYASMRARVSIGVDTGSRV